VALVRCSQVLVVRCVSTRRAAGSCPRVGTQTLEEYVEQPP
jgi:hypothetical protein